MHDLVIPGGRVVDGTGAVVRRAFTASLLSICAFLSFCCVQSSQAESVTLSMTTKGPTVGGSVLFNGAPAAVPRGLTFVITVDDTTLDTWAPMDFGAFPATSVSLTAQDLGLFFEPVDFSVTPLAYIEDESPQRAGLAPLVPFSGIDVRDQVDGNDHVGNPNILADSLASMNMVARAFGASPFDLTLASGDTLSINAEFGSLSSIVASPVLEDLQRTAGCLRLAPDVSCAKEVGICGVTALSSGVGAALVLADIANTACNYAAEPTEEGERELLLGLTGIILEETSMVPCLGTILPCGRLLADCFESTTALTECGILFVPPLFAVSIHSPVDIEVIDGAGDSMFVDSTGEVVSTIEGGWIFPYGDHESLALVSNPDPGEVFTVIMRGNASAGSSSTFELRILVPAGNAENPDLVHYQHVPTKEGAVAQISVPLANDSSTYLLELDLDSDGSFEAAQCPTSVNDRPTNCDSHAVPMLNLWGFLLATMALFALACFTLKDRGAPQ